MRFAREVESDEPGFQMAPMIDIVFQLIIFFMCASSFAILESQMDVNLPARAEAKPAGEIMEEVFINILADNTVLANGRQYDSPGSKDLTELRTMLTELASVFKDQVVIVQAEWQVPHERVIQVLNACAAAKIKNISFVTPEETIEEFKR